MNKLTYILFVIIAIMIFAIIMCLAKGSEYKRTIAKNEKEIKALSERFISYTDSLYDKDSERMYYTRKSQNPEVWYITSGKYDQSMAKVILNACESFEDIQRVQFMIDRCGVKIKDLAYYINILQTTERPEEEKDHLPISVLYYIAKKYGYGETGHDEYLYSEEDIYKIICGKYY